MWKDLGSPDIEDLQSVHTGDLLDRRHGLRKDDLIEIQIDALKKAMIEDQVEDLPGGEYSESTHFTI